MKYPKVSVIISTFDRPKMLAEALASVVEQTFKDYEVWVIDDGSDTALDVCATIGDDLPSLTCVPLSENSGYQSVPKNHGIQLCNGSYIAYLDDDNVWFPEHLQVLVDEIEKGSADLVYSLPTYVGERWDGVEDKGRIPEFVQATPQALRGLVGRPDYGFIDTSAMLHSRAAFRMAFGGEVWNEKIRRFGDWDLTLRAANAGLRMRGIDKATYEYRWHDTNLQKTRPPNELSMLVRKGTPPHLEWKGAEGVA